MSPTFTVSRGMVPTARGGLFGTVTEKLWVAVSPPGSVAVTVTVAVPRATPSTFTRLPLTATVATLASEVSAVYVSRSRSSKYDRR